MRYLILVLVLFGTSCVKNDSPNPVTKNTTQSAPAPVPTPAPPPPQSQEPLPKPVPIPAPVPKPTPIPAPVPKPVPIPAPVPKPIPIPAPVPKPIPIPAPVPKPVPIPAPVPKPIPIPAPVPKPVPIPAPVPKPEPLVWESASHPERLKWSSSLLFFVEASSLKLNQAIDLSTFCKKYLSLTNDQKNILWAEIFAATAYYESAWDPKVTSVDVGTKSDADTWSVGLLQLSVVDQQNYNLKFGFNFLDLKDAIKNLQLGVAIMSEQIRKHGKVLIPTGSSGLYWAVLHPGGKYDQSAGIIKMTQGLSFCK